MNVKYYGAKAPVSSAAYIAYRDRVTGSGGSIASATACQRAIDFLAANQGLGFDQYLDSAFGVRADASVIHWYSLLGPATEVSTNGYGLPMLGNDSLLNSPVWSKGTFTGPSTPKIPPTDSYTFGLRFYEASPNGGQGYLFGARFGDPEPQGQYTQYGQWWLITNGYVQYRYNDAWEVYPQFAYDTWNWLWLVLDATTQTATFYDETNTVLASHSRTDFWGPMPFGIGGGASSDGPSGPGLRYCRFLRCRAALSAAQRAAIQAL